MAVREYRMSGGMYGEDMAESMARDVDQEMTYRTGISIFHVLTVVSILASLALFISGRRMLGLFVGLWPPTIQAVKSVVENR